MLSVNTSTIYRLRKQMEKTGSVETVPLCVAANMFFRWRYRSYWQLNSTTAGYYDPGDHGYPSSEGQWWNCPESCFKNWDMSIKRNPFMLRNRSVPDIQLKRKKLGATYPGERRKAPCGFSMKAGSIRTWPDVMHGRKESAGGWQYAVKHSSHDNGPVLYTPGWFLYLHHISGRHHSRTIWKLPEIVFASSIRSWWHRCDGQYAFPPCKIVKNLLAEKHIQYLYLPPYSPDYNPIENMWSKIKANMRKQKVRAATLLPEAIGKAFSTIHISDCIGWFRACGYVQ